jgi:hypothetical protein
VTPQATAISLLDELGINELPIVPKVLCQRLNIHLSECSSEGFDGMLILQPITGNALICINSNIPEQTRKNYTIAHEIGHLCMDTFEQNMFYCSREVIESYKPFLSPVELRANEFAAELLMPQNIYQPLVDSKEADWDHIKELANLSQTSLTSTAIRFIDLTSAACCLIVSRECKIEWFHKSKDFCPYLQMNSRRLSRDTIAYKIFHGYPPPDNFEDVKADNWLSGRGVNRYTDILEWSLPINSYDRVLTLLYDEEGIAGWDEDEDTYEEKEVEWEQPTFHKSKRK